jgi:hypothetical protein
MKINNMTTSTMMIHLQRGNWQVRDHADERSVCWWWIASVEGLRGLPIDRRPHWLHHGPSRRHRWRNRVGGKSFGMKSGALEREGSRCITFPLTPCLYYYSLGVIDHPTTVQWARRRRHISATGQWGFASSHQCVGGWWGFSSSCQCNGPEGNVTCCDRLLTPPTRVRLHGIEEHVIRVVKILDDRILCDPMKYKNSK